MTVEEQYQLIIALNQWTASLEEAMIGTTILIAILIAIFAACVCGVVYCAVANWLSKNGYYFG